MGSIITILIVAIVLSCIIFITKSSNHAYTNQLKILAQYFGLKLVSDGIQWVPFSKKPYVRGNYRNIPLMICNYTERAVGISDTTYTAIKARCVNQNNLLFRIHKWDTGKISKVLGEAGIKTNDLEFSSKFIMHGNNIELIQAVLTDEIKQKFYNAWFYQPWHRETIGTVVLKNNEIQYLEMRLIRDEIDTERFKYLTGLLCDLVEAVNNLYQKYPENREIK